MSADNVISLDLVRKLRQRNLGPDIDTMREDILRILGADIPDTIEHLTEPGVCDDCTRDKDHRPHDRRYRHGSLNLCPAHLEPRLRVYARLQEAANA